ncbi:hypothetical protein [Enterobacter sp. PTB]|uniref:hypothetical protein n=1 Tax=Enterobacter sp. PTB TaxID=3143437 RepID=UPI003DA8729C
MNKQPTEYDYHFRIWYCYWLETMTETLNRRIETIMNAIMLFLGALVSGTHHFSWLFGIIIAILSACRVAWQFGKKAEAARQQAKRYGVLAHEMDELDLSEVKARLSMIEEFDSVTLNSLFNPARNRACISLNNNHRESLTVMEKFTSLLGGGVPH